MTVAGESTAAEAVQAALDLCGRDRAMLIPVLQDVQKTLGYLPEEAIVQIADGLRMSASEVFGVVSFYAQFRLSPTGKNVVRVCRGTACHVRGGAGVRRAVEQELGVEENETTGDMKYTYQTVACLGACALAPVMMMNEVVYGHLNAEKARQTVRSVGSSPESSEEGS